MPAAVQPSAAAVTRERILDATIASAAATGLRKLSMDEIAASAGVARATLYLHFPGRGALIDAAVGHELERLFARVRAAAARHDDPRERLVHVFASAYRELRAHDVLDAVLRVNPQLILPYVLGDAPAIALGRAFVAELVPTGDAFAEHVVRALHSLVLAPSDALRLDARGGPERYARRWLLPLMPSIER